MPSQGSWDSWVGDSGRVSELLVQLKAADTLEADSQPGLVGQENWKFAIAISLCRTSSCSVHVLDGCYVHSLCTFCKPKMCFCYSLFRANLLIRAAAGLSGRAFIGAWTERSQSNSNSEFASKFCLFYSAAPLFIFSPKSIFMSGC